MAAISASPGSVTGVAGNTASTAAKAKGSAGGASASEGTGSFALVLELASAEGAAPGTTGGSPAAMPPEDTADLIDAGPAEFAPSPAGLSFAQRNADATDAPGHAMDTSVATLVAESAGRARSDHAANSPLAAPETRGALADRSSRLHGRLAGRGAADASDPAVRVARGGAVERTPSGATALEGGGSPLPTELAEQDGTAARPPHAASFAFDAERLARTVRPEGSPGRIPPELGQRSDSAATVLSGTEAARPGAEAPGSSPSRGLRASAQKDALAAARSRLAFERTTDAQDAASPRGRAEDAVQFARSASTLDTDPAARAVALEGRIDLVRPGEPGIAASHGSADSPTLASVGAGLPAETARSAATHAVHRLGVPIQHPAWGEQFANVVQWIAQGRISSAEIRITPPELGPIQVRLSLDGDAAAVSFAVASPEVRALVEANMPRLREALESSGFSLQDASVQSGAQDQRHEPGQPRDGFRSTRPAPLAASESARATALRSADRAGAGGIDVFA